MWLDHHCKGNLEDDLDNGKEYECFNFPLAFELCVAIQPHFNRHGEDANGLTEVGKEPFLQGSAAGAVVFSRFIHNRVTQKCCNRQTLFSESALLS